MRILATFNNGTTEFIMESPWPAVIGDALMGWTQKLQYRRFPITITADASTGAAQIILHADMSRKSQIDAIDSLVGWCRNHSGKSIPVPATDEYWLYYRK